ncbi:hypothetical protein H9Q72_005850 [Fusarium xylarioides]|uniref:Transcription factor domain-containing protein n=1 Tax=Fusarium xylarioides TaxID=221167 RepID=A0A9P7HTA6_9HYPO|nr:hypothetical protein H9Q72_005850 [Fusarium xylarioides]
MEDIQNPASGEEPSFGGFHQSRSEAARPLADTLVSDSNSGPDSHSSIPWYLTAASWELASAPRSECLTLAEDSLKSFIHALQTWMKQWTLHGHCAFIHRSLYSDHMPVIIQDAYTTLAAYQTKTPTNQTMILRICKDRISSLIQSQSLNSVDGTIPDTITHLSRTQALVIYLAICLFDGDINARARAEQALDVLLPWGYQLVQSASIDTCLQTGWNSPPSDDAVSNESATTSDPTPCLDGNIETLWRVWARVESIRRTFLIIVLLATIYSTLKTGMTGCPGGLCFTGNEGLWDASSAYIWKSIMKRVNDMEAGFKPIFSHQLGDILTTRKPTEIDDFTYTTLIVTFGQERIEGWKGT